MDALEFFMIRYEALHGRNDEDVVAGLTDDEIRRRPLPGVNSIAWLLWHMTRCEDIGINRLVADHPQVLFDGDWAARVNVSLTDIGTGMADDEVTDFSAHVDLGGLRAYRKAVGKRTLDVVRALRPEDLDDVLDPAHVRRVAQEGAFGANAGWVEEKWRGVSKGWCLAQLGLTHNFAHFGEAYVVHGLLGRRRR